MTILCPAPGFQERRNVRPLTVLHLALGLRGGGAERFIAQLIEHQRESGIDAQACIFQKGAVDYSWCRNLPPPIQLEYSPKQGWRGRLATRILVRQLRGLVRQRSPDIIHAHLWPVFNIIARATCNIKQRQVWHIHGKPDWLNRVSFSGLLRRIQMGQMIRRCRPLFIACSEDVRRAATSALGLKNQEIVTVRNGVNLEKFSPAGFSGASARDCVKIIMVAAFRPLKGHSCLLDAIELLRARGLSFHCTLAGDTNSATGKLIYQSVQHRGLSDVVTFSGHLTDVAEALRASDIFVLPSDSEGLPLSVLEAMACGLPVVATNVGGIPEVVIEGETGFLVPPQDSATLAARLEALTKSEDLRLRMGAAAAEKARKCHSFEDCVEAILSVYNFFEPVSGNEDVSALKDCRHKRKANFNST